MPEARPWPELMSAQKESKNTCNPRASNLALYHMKSFFAKIWGITSNVFNFFLPILKEVASSSVAALLPIALEIVESLAYTDKTGAQKREAAVKKLTTEARKQGISASESLIRFAIESAVQRYKLDL